jgi:hypothetical protein
LQEMNSRSLSILLIMSERLVLVSLSDHKWFLKSICPCKRHPAIFLLSNLECLILIDLFKFELDIFCFEAFESQKSNHAALLHLILFTSGL